MNLLDALAIMAVAWVVVAYFDAFVDGRPNCRICLEPRAHPFHRACGWKRCDSLHHSYEPRTGLVDGALAIALIVIGVRLAAMVAGL